MTANWIRTHCSRFDHGGCGMKVRVLDGRVVEVRPDSTDPFSRGWSCVKGMAAIERLYGARRLTRPLKRRGVRGGGKWEPVSWDEALDLLTVRFKDTIARFGPEGIAFAQGAPRGLEFFLLLRLANLLNTPNTAAAQHICHMPREQMAMVTCGFFPVADLDGPSRCALVWGSNPLNTNEEGVLGGNLMRCILGGAALIVVDPLRTELAERADVWLRVRPGTDDLLALGFLHLLIEENLYDRDFVRDWTTGFDDLRTAVKPYSPERVSRGTWISKEELVRAVRLYSESKPALIQWGNAIEHSINSSQTCRSLVLLMALTGNLEVPGGNIRARAPELQKLSEFICLDRFPDRSQKLINRRYGLIPRLLTVPNWMLVQAILDQSPYPVRGLYAQGTNPLVSCASSDKVFRALSRLDFLAVADIVMTPTAAMADLVLPAATHLEFNDIGHYGLPHGIVFARPKAVEPRCECRADMKILNEWGRRMGFEPFFPDDPEQILDELLAPSGLDYRGFVEKGMLRGGKTYRTYEEKGFSTPGGKVECRSSLLEKWGHNPLPSATDPVPLSGDFPFLLTSSKPKNFFHSGYRHLDMLRSRHPGPRTLIHPETARALGIKEGDSVRVVTASGSMVQEVLLSGGIDPRVVYADYGWWFPEEEEKDLFGRRKSNINCLTTFDGAFDPVLGTTQMRALPCRIEKCVQGE